MLTRESISTTERKLLVDKISALYLEAAIEEKLDVPRNKFDEINPDQLRRHVDGKQTLVFA